MSQMVMVRAGDQQNVFVATGMSKVAEVITALAIQHVTVLGIVIGESSEPVITVQYNQRLVEALGLEQLKPGVVQRPFSVDGSASLGGCTLRWVHRVGLH